MTNGFSRRQLLGTIGSLLGVAAAQKVVPTQLEQAKAAPVVEDKDGWYERVRAMQNSDPGWYE